MARKVDSMDELKADDKVFMFTTEFPATVLETEAIGYTVKVRDDNGFSTHFLTVSRLLKASPYVVGEKYIDDSGDTYTFTSETDDDNAWTSTSGILRGFYYPDRPLRLVTYGPELND